MAYDKFATQQLNYTGDHRHYRREGPEPIAPFEIKDERKVEVYSIRHDPMRCAPFGIFLISIGEKFIGSQLSYPDLDNCRTFPRPK